MTAPAISPPPPSALSAYRDLAFQEAFTDATHLCMHEPILVPGPFQTPAYTRVLLAALLPSWTDEAIEQMVAHRQSLQHHLLRQGGPRVELVIGEAAIRRQVGGRLVMAEQLQALDLPHDRLDLRVVPLASGAYSGMNTPYIIVTAPSGSLAAHEDSFDQTTHSDIRTIGLRQAQFAAAQAAALDPAASRQLILQTAASFGRP